eukprot:227807-Hanusia_phi.AAC.2
MILASRLQTPEEQTRSDFGGAGAARHDLRGRAKLHDRRAGFARESCGGWVGGVVESDHRWYVVEQGLVNLIDESPTHIACSMLRSKKVMDSLDAYILQSDLAAENELAISKLENETKLAEAKANHALQKAEIEAKLLDAEELESANKRRRLQLADEQVDLKLLELQTKHEQKKLEEEMMKFH